MILTKLLCLSSQDVNWEEEVDQEDHHQEDHLQEDHHQEDHHREDHHREDHQPEEEEHTEERVQSEREELDLHTTENQLSEELWEEEHTEELPAEDQVQEEQLCGSIEEEVMWIDTQGHTSDCHLISPWEDLLTTDYAVVMATTTISALDMGITGIPTGIQAWQVSVQDGPRVDTIVQDVLEEVTICIDQLEEEPQLLSEEEMTEVD